MNLPLPKSLHTEKPTGDYNAGLWYDKFFHHWDEGFKEVSRDGKSQWIGEFSNSKVKVGDPRQLEEQYQRLRRMTAACAGRLLRFKTDGRFVTGLGREHPIENGFAWHHTLGVPYLPGSSVKGIVRAWAREQGVEKGDIERIFGPANQNNASVGSVIVGDALPTASVQLAAEVMTPHYGLYYQDKSAATPPADWHDPNPIPFLAVDKGQTFTFMLIPRRANDAGDIKDCETATAWLCEALIWLGAGAKTSVGYGRFTRADEQADLAAAAQAQEEREKQEHAARAKRMQGLSPMARELEHTIAKCDLEADKNAFSAWLFSEDWLDKLEQNPEPDAMERFQSLVRKHFPGLLENPDKTQGKKQKPAFKPRQQEIARRVNRLLRRDSNP
ncbi:MAG: type III-B CRISPR module RAMP protein Cmr6 [Gammaproteobacteria bacterium]